MGDVLLELTESDTPKFNHSENNYNYKCSATTGWGEYLEITSLLQLITEGG